MNDCLNQFHVAMPKTPHAARFQHCLDMVGLMHVVWAISVREKKCGEDVLVHKSFFFFLSRGTAPFHNPLSHG